MALFCATTNGLLAEDPLPDVSRLQSSPVLRHLKKNPIPAPPKTPAEETVAQFYVPEGFRVDLVLSEPDLHQPIAFTFDERGRIWVAEAYSYPTKRPPGQGEDKIVIFEDKDDDGKFETRKVFAENLNLVSGLEVGFGGVWVGAAPELLFIPDKNRDDIPDAAPIVLLDGFGYQDTHECLNSFTWGPDGWLYGIQGVFNLAHIGKPGAADAERKELRAGVWRYHPIRREFEIFAHGGSNPWGLDYDEHGQFFMTHCRSYWGGGGTTHVIPGAQFWNQANANYAPYIIADPPADFPELRNYLLASARHDHGAGGAGARGTDAIFGGHSHVGTMIYYGDNWPIEYRGQLFTHNLGGHQINREINQRSGSGFETVHAENDMLFCTDPKYVAVDLQYGPDGAVYFIDWYDQQHCHNPNTERWDRSNGRLYRMVWEGTYKPRSVNIANAGFEDLLRLQTHVNNWFHRTARRIIQERIGALIQSEDPAVTARLEPAIKALAVARNSPDATQRLRALWILNSFQGYTNPIVNLEALISDKDEYVRAWAIRLASGPNAEARFVRAAITEASPLVRLELAAAIQKSSAINAWRIADGLAKRGEDAGDRNIPKLLFQSIALRMTNGPEVGRALTMATNTAIPQLADWIYWYAVRSGGGAGWTVDAVVSGRKTPPRNSLDLTFTNVALANGNDLARRLGLIAHALDGIGAVKTPASWTTLAPALYANQDARVIRAAERIAAAFGDKTRFPSLRATLEDNSSPADARKHAFEVLTRAQDAESLPVFLKLIKDPAFSAPLIPQLARYDSADISASLIAEFETFKPEQRAAALNVLTSRASYALALLDAVDAKKIGRNQLTSFHLRQLTQLNNPEVEKRATSVWGKFAKTSDEKKSQIDSLEKTFNEAPLWAYSANAGREHFKKLCSQCHKMGEDGVVFGPDLTGSGRHGIRYVLENVIDPNAVVGVDFQMTNVHTTDGELITGLLVEETDAALTIRTQTDKVTVAKAKISKRELSEKSLMPEALLDSLPAREQLELLKYLTGK